MEAIDRHWAKVGPAIRPALLMATCQGMFTGRLETGPRQDHDEPKSGPKTYGLHHGP